MSQDKDNSTMADEILALGKRYGINLDDYDTPFPFALEIDRISRNGMPPYPNEKNFEKFNLFFDGKVQATGVSRDEMTAVKSSNPNVLVERILDTDGLNECRLKYQEVQADLSSLFIGGLKYLTKTLDNRKAGEAYSLAYERGHSAGYSEVAGEYVSLLPLIVD